MSRRACAKVVSVGHESGCLCLPVVRGIRGLRGCGKLLGKQINRVLQASGDVEERVDGNSSCREGEDGE
jgi:hypothetical protein